MPHKSKNAVIVKDPPDIDDFYLRVWEKQQEWTATRWGVVTFYLSISFALFGLSLQNRSSSSANIAQRVLGLTIYWFAYFIFRRYDDWSKFLRAYLEELETTTSTRLSLQTRWRENKGRGFRRWTSISKLLLYFGLIYAVSIVILWWIGL
jgi:hypothetical protein